MFAGTMRRNEKESEGKSNETHLARVDAAKDRLDKAGRALRDDQTISLELPGTHVPAGRTVFLGERMQIAFGDHAIFADSGIDLAIRGPERIPLTGQHGDGKSTLLRIVNGSVSPPSG